MPTNESQRDDNEGKKFKEFNNEIAVNTINLFSTSISETRVENDSSGNVIYVGLAPVGSLESESKWVISKISYDVNGFFSSQKWANSEKSFDKVWNDRVGYNYVY